MVDVKNSHLLGVSEPDKNLGQWTILTWMRRKDLALLHLVLVTIFIQVLYESTVIKFEWCDAHLKKISYVSPVNNLRTKYIFLYI